MHTKIMDLYKLSSSDGTHIKDVLITTSVSVPTPVVLIIGLMTMVSPLKILVVVLAYAAHQATSDRKTS